jgi:microcystin-dependent protein
MMEPFTGQVEVFGFGFAPRNWATCAGQLMSISQNQALFSLLGTAYGGDGRTTFALPDLRGRVPMGYSVTSGPYPLGKKSGQEAVVLQTSQVPSHTHPPLTASNDTSTTNNTNTPDGNVGLGVTAGFDTGGTGMVVNIYAADAAPKATLHPSAVTQWGGQPHENRMPSLALNFCIALFGTYPSRN